MPTHHAIAALLERNPWVARAMLVCCSLSLLATSPDHEPEPPLVFTSNVQAPAVALTAENPTRSFLITITSEEWPSGLPLTDDADLALRGSLHATDVTGDAPFVAVHVERGGVGGATDLNVLTSFTAARSLEFTGSCDAPAGSSPPCTTEVLVSFTRLDGGAGGGSVNVDWSLSLEASTPSDDSFNGSTELPWLVEFTSP
jgi:hypothetical protein